jgi:hypothetical protein
MPMLRPGYFDLIDDFLRSQQPQSDLLRDLLQKVSGNAAVQGYLLADATKFNEPQGTIRAVIEMPSQDC